MNPYWNKDFFGFFITLIKRLFGQLPSNGLASDEVQLLVLSGVALSAALIGTFLTLKKMTMLANSLSHTILLGIAMTSFLLFSTALTIDLTSLLIASFITALLTTVLTHFLTRQMRLQEDASIGLVFTSLFALGVTLVTIFTKDSHIGIEAIMGNADALHPDDIWIVFSVASLNLCALFLFFKEFKITAFDSALATSLGIPTAFFNIFLMVLTAATAIGAFRAVGVLLVLAFLVGPTLTARLWTDRLGKLISLSCLFGITASAIGVALSRHFLSLYQLPLSTGGMVVTVIGLLYLLSLCLTFRRKKVLI